MKTIKIAGVPEHFNHAWQMCIENGEFNEVGINLEWTNVPEGTGRLNQMLRDNETDMAIILTEGIIKDIANGNQSKIIQKYIQSPLLWGIHVANASEYKTLADLENKKAAISRFGSGSHLMAFVNAANNQWNKESVSFEVVHTIDGAVEALIHQKADYFMWERFMTQPLVDNGTFRKLADCPTPWPSFIVVATKKALDENKHCIAQILEIINNTTIEFKQIPSIDRTLANVFNLKLENVQQWLRLTQWSQTNFTEKEFDVLQNQLMDFEIITEKKDFSTYAFSLE